MGVLFRCIRSFSVLNYRYQKTPISIKNKILQSLNEKTKGRETFAKRKQVNSDYLIRDILELIETSNEDRLNSVLGRIPPDQLDSIALKIKNMYSSTYTSPYDLEKRNSNQLLDFSISSYMKKSNSSIVQHVPEKKYLDALEVILTRVLLLNDITILSKVLYIYSKISPIPRAVAGVYLNLLHSELEKFVSTGFSPIGIDEFLHGLSLLSNDNINILLSVSGRSQTLTALLIIISDHYYRNKGRVRGLRFYNSEYSQRKKSLISSEMMKTKYVNKSNTEVLGNLPSYENPVFHKRRVAGMILNKNILEAEPRPFFSVIYNLMKILKSMPFIDIRLFQAIIVHSLPDIIKNIETALSNRLSIPVADYLTTAEACDELIEILLNCELNLYPDSCQPWKNITLYPNDVIHMNGDDTVQSKNISFIEKKNNSIRRHKLRNILSNNLNLETSILSDKESRNTILQYKLRQKILSISEHGLSVTSLSSPPIFPSILARNVDITDRKNNQKFITTITKLKYLSLTCTAASIDSCRDFVWNESELINQLTSSIYTTSRASELFKIHIRILNVLDTLRNEYNTKSEEFRRISIVIKVLQSYNTNE